MRGIILPKTTIQTKAYWATVSMTDIGYVLWPEYCLCVVFVILVPNYSYVYATKTITFSYINKREVLHQE